MTYDIHTDILYSQDISVRIVELAAIPDLAANPEHDEEYVKLLRFQKAAIDAYGMDAWVAGISFIADSYWPTYAQDQAEYIYGDVAKTPYWNRELYTADLKRGFAEHFLDGITYWTDGEL